MVVILLFSVAALSSSSYLTGSGNRFLYDSIAVETSYVTDSMIAVGGFLNRAPVIGPLTLDPALAPFIASEDSGVAYPVTPYPIDHRFLVAFSTGFGNASVTLVLSDVYLSYSGYEAPDTRFLDGANVNRVYDNGNVRVYAPGGD